MTISKKEELPFEKSVVIIPTYNEAENIEKMLSELFENYPAIHILIIDDGSPDKTAELVKKFQQNSEKGKTNLHLIERSGKQGLGTAYLTGFRWAFKHNFDYLFEMDCDFSHDPKDLKGLLNHCLRYNCDLVIGSRYYKGIRVINWPLKRLLLSSFASIYARFVTGIPLKDTTGGFKCFKVASLKELNLNKIRSNGYSFQLELNYKFWAKGLKIEEFPIIFYERRDGQSKMGLKIVLEAIYMVFVLRLKKVFGTLL